MKTLADLDLEITKAGRMKCPPAKFCLSASELSSSEVEITATATTSYQNRDMSSILQKNWKVILTTRLSVVTQVTMNLKILGIQV
ncbi:uncharacterized protein LOC106652771 isoform X3 [Trichogramma pretiosum]|uniref:uncharacterized protein LOC106652771 isoform X3 n=1 Tax=Trichogramma pretiosum TaxID=7493 RepID=UPI000C71ADA8|nr:uncharacterized protein LOC106652771 isoform X3 [Trichogramma pretiosum]